MYPYFKNEDFTTTELLNYFKTHDRNLCIIESSDLTSFHGFWKIEKIKKGQTPDIVFIFSLSPVLLA